MRAARKEATQEGLQSSHCELGTPQSSVGSGQSGHVLREQRVQVLAECRLESALERLVQHGVALLEHIRATSGNKQKLDVVHGIKSNRR